MDHYHSEPTEEQLSERLREWLRDDLGALMANWKSIASAGDTQETRRNLFVSAHNLKGVASAYGYPVIGRLCGSLCRLLSQSAPGEHIILARLHVKACLAAYRKLVPGADNDADANAVCDALERRVSYKLSLPAAA